MAGGCGAESLPASAVSAVFGSAPLAAAPAGHGAHRVLDAVVRCGVEALQERRALSCGGAARSAKLLLGGPAAEGPAIFRIRAAVARGAVRAAAEESGSQFIISVVIGCEPFGGTSRGTLLARSRIYGGADAVRSLSLQSAQCLAAHRSRLPQRGTV
eukprot:CAMPEP_0206063406 /NCGR_PEP_ID=MMETSP1466-20131121/58210_1 /ASSEMBLY_ACC=CAM_ASM_001126 /TAXON_ID=44452 /ORGANISM="Pavlova gyrans, Strain CCMP608" /LENGTH=156 /DNA_ID=CAMNT_0053438775 /DNA_START=625 /DNA_END=1092 /DNA_ORIENTATION=-